ncbi:MAG: histidine kinase [Saprospiraceae bacterium]|nr:histidine kinase [Saprospiraceae bacterium]
MRLNQWIIIAFWAYSFILHPLLLANVLKIYVENDIIFSNINVRKNVIYELTLTIGGALFITEIAIQFNNNLLQWINKIKWIQRFGLERGIISVVLLLAFISGISGVMELIEIYKVNSFSSVLWYIFKLISFTIQFMLIGLTYYFFYYANHYVLIPKLLKQKGLIYYGFSVLTLILVFYPVFVFFIRYLPAVNELKLGAFTANEQIFATDGGGMPFLIIVLSVPIIISNQWFKQTGEIAILAKEKSEAELNLLKQQINPHFFFNTLNNLYALSLKNDTATPGVIMQLSELMRYVIYRGKEETVSLSEEIKHIEDYIYLQRLRLYKKLDLQFTKDITDENLQIPPLLFIILVENAFKHGIEPAENECFLHICIKSDHHNLSFSCKNSMEEKSPKEAGIGLNNLKRRLELKFPNRHELQIEKDNNIFKALLKINL